MVRTKSSVTSCKRLFAFANSSQIMESFEISCFHFWFTKEVCQTFSFPLFSSISPDIIKDRLFSPWRFTVNQNHIIAEVGRNLSKVKINNIYYSFMIHQASYPLGKAFASISMMAEVHVLISRCLNMSGSCTRRTRSIPFSGIDVRPTCLQFPGSFLFLNVGESSSFLQS